VQFVLSGVQMRSIESKDGPSGLLGCAHFAVCSGDCSRCCCAASSRFRTTQF
jgi:hypothetical protein